MGWDFRQGATKQDTINELIKGFENDKCKRTCLQHSVRGNILWTVWMMLDKTTGRFENLIGCDILSSQRNFGWGYKSLSESMHPYYYSCPLKYLDLAPVACQEWRDKVHAYHTEKAMRRSKKIAIGDTVPLKNCDIPEVKIIDIKPSVREYVGEYQGKLYRILKKMIAV